MTDEERTSMQTQPATGTKTESAPADAQDQEPGLLSKLTTAAKQAVQAVTERVTGSEDHPVDQNEQSGDQEEPSLVERVSDAAQTAATQVRRVGARVYDRIVSSDEDAQPATTAADAPTAQADASAASETEATAATETPSSTREAAEDSTEAGASFEPVEAGAKGGKPRRFRDVQPGMQLEGRVTSIALYGIFVDVGVGRDGLVHISEMSDTRIESPTDMVQIGDPVTVWVKSVDPEAWRISLTMRDPHRAKPPRERRPRKPQVDREKLSELKQGDMIEGTVTSIAPFGVFVDIGVGKDGLVHISELSEDRVEKPEDAVQVGQQHTFRILEVDPEGKRISLSLRRAQRVARLQQLEPGTVLDGTVSGMAPFGAFVDVGVGRDGLVHISELSSGRVGSVDEVVKVGDKVQVKVIEVDPNSKRISLTMRVDEPLPTDRPQPVRTSRPVDALDVIESEVGHEGRQSERQIDYSKFERRPQKSGGGGRKSRPRREAAHDEEETFSYQDPDEEETFTGDATLEDLVSKFNAGKGRRNNRRDDRDEREEDDEEDDDSRRNNRRNVINRTLAMMDDE